MTREGKLGWLGSGSLWTYRVLTWTVLAAGLAFAATIIALRYWILPDIGQYREAIARAVSERAGQRITIGRIEANWDGLRPQLRLENVTVHDAEGRPAIRLPRLDQTLSWLSVAMLELRFYAIDIHRPTLAIRRDAKGVISVGGVEMGDGNGDNTGFADWLLRQRDIELHNAAITWHDDLRGAPPLALRDVSLHVYSRLGRHRFALRATPPLELAAPVDVRGDLSGETVKSLANWSGQLFVQLDYADIAAWRTWVPFPIELPRGAGALRAWLSVDRHQLVDITADVRLVDVLARLGPELPVLDLAALSGRLGWKQSAAGFEVSTAGLGLSTAAGLALAPADFLLRVTPGSARRQGRGELRANALDLEPLAVLADHLPLAPEARAQLAAYAPKGSLHDVVVRWTGDWQAPQQFGVRGRFHNLSLKRSGRIPGFSGVSGSLEGSERGGTLSLNAHKGVVDMPLVFRDALEFDALSAQVGWTRGGSGVELRLNSISFSNAHLSGTVFGNYRTAATGRGEIDLTGILTRAEARYAGRYIPLVVGKDARDWLDKAFLGGRSSDVTLRLKGNLDEFPFPEGKGGVFQVAAKVSGGVLHFADGWPNIENIAGDLLFRGRRMDIQVRQAALSGARLSKVQVSIPDLLHTSEVLNVKGEAEGATADFLAFVDATPVGSMIDRFTAGWRAQGPGRLSLDLSIPLRDAAKAKVSGAYEFTANTLAVAPGLPAVEQATGRIAFTDASVNAQNVTGVFLGGPVTLSVATARDAAVRVAFQGRIQPDNVRKAGGPAWLRNLRGATDWRGIIQARRDNADVVIESSLQGLAIDLPAPLAKAAAEPMPLRFERRQLAAGEDVIGLSLGRLVSMNLVRRVAGGRTTISRGAVRFGGAAPEAGGEAGVRVSGDLAALDIDRWLAFLGQEGGDTRVEWGSVDLKLGAVDVFRRRYTDLAVSGTLVGGQWRGNLVGKGLEGALLWQPEGRGRMVARMRTLAIPEAAPGALPPEESAAATGEAPELPALDVTAEQFVNKGRALGRLELAAVPEGRNWRIEKLRIVNPESTFALDGLWQLGPAAPHTRVNVRLEASDVGKLLARLGYPEGVRRGTAKLEGVLSWNGAPYELDYPSLGGNLVLEAAKGQFVKLEPGIGKLLGILSLQALPRRVALDFRDVFSEGFTFDEIVSAVKISRGIASADNFRIQGPPARIVMSGEVDLARETQDLHLRITPRVSDTVSIAGALVGGPVAGVAAFLAQKVLKDPLDQIVSYEYQVTGTWSDPLVAKVARAAAEPAQP